MKILVFEFATATGLTNPSLTAEGHGMLEAILDDFKEYKPHYLISNSFNKLKTDAKPIKLRGDLFDWLKKNVSKYDACLPIAPEESNILHDLTEIIENKNVKVLGSNSNALKISTNKFDMYTALIGKVPVVKTEKIFFDDDLDDPKYLAMFKSSSRKVLKPADGVSCSGVVIINSYTELVEAMDDIKKFTTLKYAILQEYVEGKSVSVSLLSDGRTALPISLNSQEIVVDSNKINYHGGNVPFNHELADAAKCTAKNAVESIDGIKGYVGVDMIIDNVAGVQLIEINSRLTTPYIALKKIVDLNIGKSIIKAVNGELPSHINLDGVANFYKEGQTLRVSVIK